MNQNNDIKESITSKIDPIVIELCKTINQSGNKAYIVGGCLRDLILKKELNDWDIATTAKAEDIMKMFKKAIPTGIKHGTVTVFFKEKKFEITTLRGESGYSDGRHPDHVEFITDIYQDLSRRDFTINAIAYEPIEMLLIDPHHGCEDIDKKLIRAVGNPIDRFIEDGLRILRAIRFASVLDFDIEEKTIKAIPDSIQTFRKVSKERIREEFIKIINSQFNLKGLGLLEKTGLLKEIFPQFQATVNCSQNQYHSYTVWEHSLFTLKFCDKDDYLLKMAAFFHDIGKPIVKKWDEKKGDYIFYDHEKIGSSIVEKWLHDYKFSNSEIETVTHLIKNHGIYYSSQWTDSAIRRFIKRVGKEYLERIICLQRADIKAHRNIINEEELKLSEELQRRINLELTNKAAFNESDLKIDGHDIMKILQIESGIIIGEIKHWLIEQVLEKPELNQKEILIDLVIKKYGTKQ